MRLMAIAEHPPMAKKAGRPRKNPEMTGVKLQREVNDLAREAGAIFGEPIVVYINRIIRERAEADIYAHALKRVNELRPSQDDVKTQG